MDGSGRHFRYLQYSNRIHTQGSNMCVCPLLMLKRICAGLRPFAIWNRLEMKSGALKRRALFLVARWGYIGFNVHCLIRMLLRRWASDA